MGWYDTDWKMDISIGGEAAAGKRGCEGTISCGFYNTCDIKILSNS